MKVCAVTVSYPGVLEWLRHGHEEGLWDLVVLDQPNQGIPTDCEYVIFGGLHAGYAAIMRESKRIGVKVAVAWASSPAEMEQAPIELKLIHDYKASGLVDAWLTLNPGLAEHFPNGRHLAAPIHLEPQPREQPRHGIGFYAPATLKKNAWTQFYAVKAVQAVAHEAVLYTNLEALGGVLQEIGVNHVVEPWAERSKHLERLASRRMALCASWSESWCYGAVDAMMMGTPVVASPALPWVPANWRVENPNDPLEIAACIRDLYEVPPQGIRAWLEVVAARNNEAARRTVRELLQNP